MNPVGHFITYFQYIFLQTFLLKPCNVITDIDAKIKQSSDAIDALKATHQRLDATSRGMHTPSTSRNRQKRKNASKDARKKKERLNERINLILTKLNAKDDQVISDISANVLSSFHRRYDIPALQVLCQRNKFEGSALTAVSKFVKSSLDFSDQESGSTSESD